MPKNRLNMPSSPALAVGSLALMPAILANAIILAIPALAAFVEASNDELYYRAVQEDGTLEWMTVWAFLLAAAVFVSLARRQKTETGSTPWLTYGLAAFSFVIAMEEMSWGQRILGYRPPEYFLRENFQQEFNIHNVMDTGLRKLGLKATILGFGIVLPILALAPPIRRLLTRFGPAAAPLALIPSFAVTYWAYEEYPWRFSGEVVELMLGLGFLFAAYSALAIAERSALLKKLAVGFVITAVLGLASAAYSRFIVGDSPERLQTAQTELEALAADFVRRGRPISRCSVHKRVFSWAEKYDRAAAPILDGEFSSLVEQGLPEARAEYFIDPWNTAYWIRHKCNKGTGKEIAFLYSFGPNRRRNSNDWEIVDDDIGIILFTRGLD